VLAGVLLVQLELGANIELAAVCTTSPPIVAAPVLASVLLSPVLVQLSSPRTSSSPRSAPRRR